MTNDEKLYTSVVNVFRQNSDVSALKYFKWIKDYKIGNA